MEIKPINWSFSLDSQTDLYTHCLETLVFGNLGQNRFYLLNSLPEKFRDRVIFVPHREIAKRVVKRIRGGQSPLFNKTDREVLEEEISILYKAHKLQITKLEDEFHKSIDTVYPQIRKRFTDMDKVKITISPQLVGTLGDYSLSENVIEIHPRFDRRISNVYHLLVNALTHYFYYHGETLSLDNNRWREKQEKTIAIFQELKLSEISDSKGMLDILETDHVGKLAEESAKYYEYLSIPIKSEIDQIDLKDLTDSERKLLSLMKRNRNRVTNIEEIAECIWGDNVDEKFSPYAISKLIERLNKKLKSSGIESRLIHSQRGEGYLLFD